MWLHCFLLPFCNSIALAGGDIYKNGEESIRHENVPQGKGTEYVWRIECHVPGRFYLRLEARDTAGNLATYQTPSPIALARPQPTGRLRKVRLISD